MLLSLALCAAFSPVVVSKVSYHGWPNCFRIENGVVELVVVPQVGRLLSFGWKGGRNLLFESALSADHKPQMLGPWANYGGDKLWPAPQSLWAWPPEPAYDTTPWTAHAVSDGVSLRSVRPGEKTGVEFSRTITLEPGSATVTFENSAINRGARRMSLAVWEICQVRDPDYCILPRFATAKDPKGWQTYDAVDVASLVKVEKDRVLIRRDRSRGLKYGSASPREFVAAKIGPDLVRLQARYVKGAAYADGGKAEQLYTSGDESKYVEIEITGPLQNVASGQSITLQTKLSISKEEAK